MAQHHPVEIAPQELERAQNMWRGFTSLLKYSVIISCVVLALLALIFIDW